MADDSAIRCVDELFADWYRPLLRYAVRLTGSLPIAEDFVQEAFVSYYRALSEGRSVNCPKSYTIAAVRHQAQRAWAAQRAGRVPLMLDEVASPLIAPPADEVSLIWDHLQRLFAHRTPRETEVILLRAESLTYSEIGRELGIATTSVGTLLARAVAKLQAIANPPENVTQAREPASPALETDEGGRK